MARDGEILNRSLLQAMADYLKIGGVRRAPSQLNTDIVQPVYDLARGAGDFRYQLCRKTDPIDLEGVSIYSETIFDRDNSNDAIFVNPDFDAILTSLAFRLTYTAPGALADDLAVMNLVINRHAGYGSIDPMPVLEYYHWTSIDFATLLYPFSVWSSSNVDSTGVGTFLKNPGLFSPFMPAGDRFSISIWRDVGNWPANTQIQFFTCMLTQTPQPQVPYITPS